MLSLTIAIAITLGVALEAPAVPPSAEQVRRSVERSLVFSEKGTLHGVATTLEVCFLSSCGDEHLGPGPRPGAAVSRSMINHWMRWWITPSMTKGPSGGNEEFLGIYMHLASPAAAKLDDETAAWLKKMSALMLSQQAADGSWDMNKLRAPPILDVGEVQTMQALLALAAAHDKGLIDDAAWISARDRALAWLGKSKFLDQNPVVEHAECTWLPNDSARRKRFRH